jgi:hypothetical protein
MRLSIRSVHKRSAFPLPVHPDRFRWNAQLDKEIADGSGPAA